MVKTLLAIVMANIVLLLELAGVALLATAFGLWFGTPAVLAVIGVAVLVKSVELDLGRAGSDQGPPS